ncbi:metalloregulator ArsR/SmtB family transcription factor [Lactobacillus delbrueckii subsp. bulgaricus]|uniref:ArsR/SmtB family transcription factor n=1 Tax=Lactobacillus delbrueckii TaxID=1584 RepID=UPI001E4ED8D5|nr:metalloregulator ArsR/SmtB family transcription factor [Lactobacillus delbrueckii]MCD5480878.1 metalloregulator ArsR/SmtB family transcription factor [Lactobacillus delbrueckii subsp. bulgaricus]
MTHEELIDRAARLFKVLGNSLRIHILFYLRKHGESPVSAIVGHLGVSQPVISKQLGILKKYDFVQKRKAGTFVYYSINDQDISINDQDIVQIIDAMTEHLDHLDRLQ